MGRGPLPKFPEEGHAGAKIHTKIPDVSSVKLSMPPLLSLAAPSTHFLSSPAKLLHLGNGVEQRDVVGRHAQHHLLGPDAALAVHDGQLPRGILHRVHPIFLAQAERHQVLAWRKQ